MQNNLSGIYIRTIVKGEWVTNSLQELIDMGETEAAFEWAQARLDDVVRNAPDHGAALDLLVSGLKAMCVQILETKP